MLLRKAVSGKPIKILNINTIIIFYRVFKDLISFNGFKGVSKDTVVNKIIINNFYKESLKVVKAFEVHFKDLFSSNSSNSSNSFNSFNSFKVYKASSGLLVSQN